MAKTKVNLASLFGNVAQELAKNQNALNQADTQNNDHGDNMVNVFNTITQALENKPKGTPSSQLEYASEQVRQNCQSGSGAVYADGLARAAAELQGQNLNSANAMQLITALMGSAAGAQATPQANQAGESDPLAGMLGTLLGSAAQSQQQTGGSNATGDALSTLLGGLLGGEQSSPQSASGSGINMQQVLAAGMEFMQSQQQGQDTMSSLLDAVVAGTQAGSGYRAESGKLVAGTLMQGLGVLLGKK
jgi:hypothetical protein